MRQGLFIDKFIMGVGAYYNVISSMKTTLIQCSGSLQPKKVEYFPREGSTLACLGRWIEVSTGKEEKSKGDTKLIP